MYLLSSLKTYVKPLLYFCLMCLSGAAQSNNSTKTEEHRATINQFLDELSDDTKLKAEKEINLIRNMLSSVESIMVNKDWDGQTIASYTISSNTLNLSDRIEYISENLALVFLFHEAIHFKRVKRYSTNRAFSGQQANYFGLVALLAEEYSEELVAYYFGAHLAGKIVNEYQFTCSLNNKTFPVSKQEFAIYQTLSVLASRIKELEEINGDWDLNLMYKSVIQLISDARPRFRKVIKNTDIENLPYSVSLACGLNI